MAIGHFALRTHSRKRQHTAAGALAYRAGDRLVDSNGIVHDYRNRARSQSILESGVSAPDRWAGEDDLQQLADAIECAEKRKDSRLLRDCQMALPAELKEAQQIEVAQGFAAFLRDRYDTPVAWAVHRPDPGDEEADERNVHAHLILPTRSLNEDGDAFGAKLRVLDCAGTSSQEVAELRNQWADYANSALEGAGEAARVNVGQKCDDGHQRYAKARVSSTPAIRGRAKALLRDVRLLMFKARDDMDSIRMSARQYFAIAYSQSRLPAWARAILGGGSGAGRGAGLAFSSITSRPRKEVQHERPESSIDDRSEPRRRRRRRRRSRATRSDPRLDGTAPPGPPPGPL